MSELIIIKIGGGKSTNVKNVVNDVAGVMKENPEKRFIVLHGASNELDVLHEKMNVKKKILDLASGFESRKTDDEVMDLLLMAYAGKTNKRTVSAARNKLSWLERCGRKTNGSTQEQGNQD